MRGILPIFSSSQKAFFTKKCYLCSRNLKIGMKKYINYAYFAIMAVAAELGAGCNSSAKWNDLEFYQVEKVEYLTEDVKEEDKDEGYALLFGDKPRELDVKVDMQFLKSNNEENAQVCQLINSQLIELLLKQSSEQGIDKAIEQYIEEVKAEFRSDIAHAYYDYLTGEAEYGIENVINYRLSESVYTGGAHPSNITTILRFNAMTGEFIALDNVFPTANQNQLKERLLDKLTAKNGVQTMEELNEIGYLEWMDMFVSTNFALRQDSIEFYYNEYDIAPYAYGASTICLSYQEVQDLLSTTYEQ